jgi:hypothetical protein
MNLSAPKRLNLLNPDSILTDDESGHANVHNFHPTKLSDIFERTHQHMFQTGHAENNILQCAEILLQSCKRNKLLTQWIRGSRNGTSQL